ncbi:hypothetical protein B0J18DRAFT_69486 [Chaetomium sp. MPI-SDFR-AT-0129]|nr:hypothetical protein B0J18DRAFT_69486 [Chaetomium sp. MPI-SDFR-AT-0129]
MEGDEPLSSLEPTQRPGGESTGPKEGGPRERERESSGRSLTGGPVWDMVPRAISSPTCPRMVRTRPFFFSLSFLLIPFFFVVSPSPAGRRRESPLVFHRKCRHTFFSCCSFPVGLSALKFPALSPAPSHPLPSRAHRQSVVQSSCSRAVVQGGYGVTSERGDERAGTRDREGKGQGDSLILQQVTLKGGEYAQCNRTERGY